MEEPFLRAMDVAMIFPLLSEKIKKKTNFPIWEMILMHFLAYIKEMLVGGSTSSILNNLLPKVILTVRGLDSYTT